MVIIPADERYEEALAAFKRGEYTPETLSEYLKSKNADAGLIISGIGSMDICRLHAIEHTDLPLKDCYFNLEGPMEMLAHC